MSDEQGVPGECVFCADDVAARLGCLEVWNDSHWRLLIDLSAEVPGFSLLLSRRHIPEIVDLDGAEADTLGPTLARLSGVLKEETGALAVYLYVFGAHHRHLHFHLAPHQPGDGLNTNMIRGDVEKELTAGGVERQTSKQFPPLPEADLREVASRVAARLSAV